MANPVPDRAEPIPGYRLLEFLGRGGFGEVWKAEAPGGLHKAVKIVYGNLEALGPDGRSAAQELKALERVKTVRHPFILSLERFDIVEGQLIIVTELADCHLATRFRECRAQGLPGIPRPELLRYLEEAAEALDLMNVQYQLQHLDVKPENLFLVGNHVKVADFGLVQDLERMTASVTGGTPLYAAPETFENTVSRYCDQYSLAIVYQEMLTGKRPFAGTNARHLLLQHVNAAPDVSAAPPEDRPVIARALAKKPDERYPTCAEMVEALRHRGTRTSTTEAITPSRPAVAAAVDGETPARSPRAGGTTPRLPPLRSAPVGAPEVPEQTGEGVLVPAVVIGLGGFGRAVVQRLRTVLEARFGSREALGHLRLLAVDTDSETGEGGPEPTDGERPAEPPAGQDVLITRLNRPNQYLRSRGPALPLAGWLPPQAVYRIPRTQTAGGVRALGRLAFFDHYAAIVERLRAELSACTASGVLDRAARATGLGFRSTRPRVYIVTSLAGGTGSGMLVDVAYTARRLCRQLGHPRAPLHGLVHLPPVEPRTEPDPALANTVAALTELHHFGSPEVTFSAHYAEEEDDLTDPAPPFDRCALMPQESPGEPAEAQVGRAAGLLVWELTTPLGRAGDASRAAPQRTGLRFDTVGSFQLAWPRAIVLGRAARVLTRFLVHSWIRPGDSSLAPSIPNWAAELWTKGGWEPAAWAARLDAACTEVLGAAPEAVLASVTEAVAALLQGPNSDAAAAEQALDQLEPAAGQPGTVRSESAVLRVADALARVGQSALARAGQELFNAALAWIEEPRFWLAGAEAALRELEAILRHQVGRQEETCRRLEAQTTALYRRIRSLLRGPGSLSWLRRLGSGSPAEEAAELLRLYPRLQSQLLVQQQVAALYRGLLVAFPPRLNELSLGRSQLQALGQALEADGASQPAVVRLGPGRRLLPPGCKSRHDAVTKVLEVVGDEDLLRFDCQLQAELRRRFQGLKAWCGSPKASVKELEQVVREQAGAFLLEHLAGTDAGSVFLSRYTTDDEAANDLAAAFDEAAPLSAGSRDGRDFLAFPATSERLQDLARGALPDAQLVPLPGAEEVIFYRERTGIILTRLPQLGRTARAVYEHFANTDGTTPHARSDVSAWQPLPVE